MTYAIDFSTLPDDAAFERRSILIGPPDDLKIRLGSMPQTLERIESAIMFAALASKQGEPWRAAAFLRAALTEFCSIEEMHKLDRGKGVGFAVTASPNPLLHLLVLMRHMNIHVKSVKVTPHKIGIIFDGIEGDLDSYVVSNLDAGDLASLWNGKHYDVSDLRRCVTWFNLRQTVWGAGDLIRMGTIIFAVQICTKFRL